ncbi:hypothetical protein [Caballeronia catudaia]|uniref:hypothetical protein n=1 Tax=Caballeronia catudaia TaxID=1777136 RepID=UPI00117E0AD8|nr:hypothetical protein [Caballeronia catudaia]
MTGRETNELNGRSLESRIQPQMEEDFRGEIRRLFSLVEPLSWLRSFVADVFSAVSPSNKRRYGSDSIKAIAITQRGGGNRQPIDVKRREKPGDCVRWPPSGRGPVSRGGGNLIDSSVRQNHSLALARMLAAAIASRLVAAGLISQPAAD